MNDTATTGGTDLPDPMDEVLESFAGYARLERGLAPTTVEDVAPGAVAARTVAPQSRSRTAIVERCLTFRISARLRGPLIDPLRSHDVERDRGVVEARSLGPGRANAEPQARRCIADPGIGNGDL